jgi:hypothetical protein
LNNLRSQNIEPSAFIFNEYKAIKGGPNRTNQALNPTDSNANEFILGYQWLGHTKMLDALHMNMNQHQNQWGYFDDTFFTDANPNKERAKYLAVMDGGVNGRIIIFHGLIVLIAILQHVHF